MSTHRVLHVEDEPDIREVVAASLGLDGNYRVRSCGSGKEALTIAPEWLPDIILLDVVMPGMDGPTTLARLKSTARTTGIPVVFFTARFRNGEEEWFRSLGAAGVIPKPFDPMTLGELVRGYLKLPANASDAMRNAFLRRLNDDLFALVMHRAALSSGSTSSDTLDDIRTISHGLAGAGGTFGFPEISGLAGALEDAIVGDRRGFGSVENIRTALDRLLACAEANCFHPASR